MRSAKRLIAALALLLAVILAAEGMLQLASRFVAERSDASGMVGKDRILCVGDSHTYGVMVERGESYPARLQQILDRREPGLHAVVNRGVPGMNTSQLRNRVPGWLDYYRPDLLIVWAGVNNAWNTAELDRPPSALWSAVDRALLGSRLYRLLRVRLHTRSLDRGAVEYREAEGPDLSRVESHATADFAAIADEARAADVDLIFVTYPNPVGAFVGANDAMRRVAQEKGAYLVDSSLSLGRVPVEKREWHPGFHPGADTYAEIARDVSEIVLDRDGAAKRLPAPEGAAGS
jgi:lysophospholipase L1-like esterase